MDMNVNADENHNADTEDKVCSDDDDIDLTPLSLPSVAQGHKFAAQADEFMERGKLADALRCHEGASAEFSRASEETTVEVVKKYMEQYALTHKLQAENVRRRLNVSRFNNNNNNNETENVNKPARQVSRAKGIGESFMVVDSKNGSVRTKSVIPRRLPTQHLLAEFPDMQRDMDGLYASLAAAKAEIEVLQSRNQDSEHQLTRKDQEIAKRDQHLKQLRLALTKQIAGAWNGSPETLVLPQETSEKIAMIRKILPGLRLATHTHTINSIVETTKQEVNTVASDGVNGSKRTGVQHTNDNGNDNNNDNDDDDDDANHHDDTNTNNTNNDDDDNNSNNNNTDNNNNNNNNTDHDDNNSNNNNNDNSDDNKHDNNNNNNNHDNNNNDDNNNNNHDDNNNNNSNNNNSNNNNNNNNDAATQLLNNNLAMAVKVDESENKNLPRKNHIHDEYDSTTNNNDNDGNNSNNNTNNSNNNAGKRCNNDYKDYNSNNNSNDSNSSENKDNTPSLLSPMKGLHKVAVTSLEMHSPHIAHHNDNVNDTTSTDETMSPQPQHNNRYNDNTNGDNNNNNTINNNNNNTINNNNNNTTINNNNNNNNNNNTINNDNTNANNTNKNVRANTNTNNTDANTITTTNNNTTTTNNNNNTTTNTTTSTATSNNDDARDKAGGSEETVTTPDNNNSNNNSTNSSGIKSELGDSVRLLLNKPHADMTSKAEELRRIQRSYLE